MEKYSVGKAMEQFIYDEFYYMFIHPFSNNKEAIFRYFYPKREKIEELPEISINEVFKLMPQMRETLDELESIYPMFEFLLEISKQMVDYSVINNEKIWKYLVILHTAHNIVMNIRALKDEANLFSLNNEVGEKNFYFNDMKALKEGGEMDSFNLTYYGRTFVEIINPLIEWEFKGSIRKRGYR